MRNTVLSAPERRDRTVHRTVDPRVHLAVEIWHVPGICLPGWAWRYYPRRRDRRAAWGPPEYPDLERGPGEGGADPDHRDGRGPAGAVRAGGPRSEEHT